MPQKRLLLLISTFVFLLAIGVLEWFPTELASAIGTVIGAFAGILAVLWFSASLYYQSQQLKEQRGQFLENFKQLREESQRNALLLAKDVLGRGEERALRWNPTLKTLNDLTGYYVAALPDWRIVGESLDAQKVLEAGKAWLTMAEGPAMLLMSAIKSAGEVYFRASGTEGIDYSKKPEEFVFIYGETLWKLPFFSEYSGTAVFLSEMMVRMEPARASVELAYWVAMLKAAEQGQIANILRKDKIIDDVTKHKEAGYPLPAIVQDLIEDAMAD